jgi:hypothetical protein
MSKIYSPKIVTDGLVMCLDPSQNKSYGTTDLPVKSGLLLWLDASDDSTFSYSSGTEVSQWRDKSGNNFHANQSTTAVQPTRNTNNNSRKSVNFVAANADYMVISSGIALPNDASIFIVYKPATQSYQYAVLIDNYHGQGGNYGFVIQRVSFNSQFYYANAGDGAGFIDTSASPWTYTDNVIQLLSLNKASSTGTPYISGTAQTSRSVRAATAQYTTGLAIGYWGNGGGRFYNGDMCEILIFNRSLSSAEMKQVHTYLGQKWGISNTDRSIIDLSGFNDNGLFGDGTTSNMPAYDYYNKGGFRFDGSNDFIKVGANSSLQVNNVTIAAFFKTVNNGQSVQFITGYGDTGLAGYWIGMSGGPIRFSVGGGSGNYLQQSSGITPNNDEIYYVVGTYDGTNQRIYINGALQASATTVTGNISYTGLTDGFLLGQVQGFTAGRYLTGYIYYAQVYNRALSAAEISQNYEALKSRFANTIVQSGLVLNLDAGNPYSYAGAGTTWYDVSGNGYNGILTNGPTYSSVNGGIINLDGVDDYSISTVASIPASSTVAIWIKSSAYSGNKIPISIDGDSYGSGPNIYFSESKINWNTGDGAANAFTNSSYPDSNWHYIVVTNDSSTNAKLYIDGTLIGTASYRSTLSTVTSNFWIGKFHAGGYEIAASIGQVQLYNRALSAAEILQNYNAMKGRYGL